MEVKENWYAELPLPPSTNNLYRNVRNGRVKTEQYLDWEKEAKAVVTFQFRWPVARPKSTTRWTVKVFVYLSSWRRDIDNMMKPLIDLAARTLALDDRYLVALEAERFTCPADRERVEIEILEYAD